MRLFFWATVTCYVVLVTADGVAKFEKIGRCGNYLYGMYGFPPAEVVLRCAGRMASPEDNFTNDLRRTSQKCESCLRFVRSLRASSSIHQVQPHQS